MPSVLENCTLRFLSTGLLRLSKGFDCGKPDLNDFFLNDSVPYANALLGKSYCFTLNDDFRTIVCAFTLANANLHVDRLPAGRKRKLNRGIPSSKHYSAYPAVLIGRLAVDMSFKRQRVGHDLLHFIKLWFIDKKNKTGCRFLVVDAYNDNTALGFYEKCGFEYMFLSVAQENDYYGRPRAYKPRTRLMYFDLIEAQKK